jgi:protein-tyrosine phosphatase
MSLVLYNNGKQEGYITEILEGLYLGDIDVSQNKQQLKDHNIQHIINLSNVKNYVKFAEIEYIDIQIDDSSDVSISPYFQPCIEKIQKARINGEPILVHCMAGVSRSTTILLSYMIYNGYTLKNALNEMRKKRIKRYVRPNIGFMKQLLEYEWKHTKTHSIQLSEYLYDI